MREHSILHLSTPLAQRPYVEPIVPQEFGLMDVKCSKCSAFHWIDERLKSSPASHSLFSHCCHHGKVCLDRLPDPPQVLKTFLTRLDANHHSFCEHICQYNSMLAFASFTAKTKTEFVNMNSGGGGPWVLKSGYMIYHSAGALIPTATDNPRYA